MHSVLAVCGGLQSVISQAVKALAAGDADCGRAPVPEQSRDCRQFASVWRNRGLKHSPASLQDLGISLASWKFVPAASPGQPVWAA